MVRNRKFKQKVSKTDKNAKYLFVKKINSNVELIGIVKTTKMPSLNNENESDGDGEMSDNESQHSNSSRDAKADSSEADEPDSDSSELDESECERRTESFIKHMGDLEKQFTILREQLYQERIKQNDLHLNDVRNGRSQEYLEPLKQLNDAMQSRIEVATVLKRFRLENINNKFLAEEQGANQHFASEKEIAKDVIYEELMEKIRKLEEDRHNVDISWADWNTSTRSTNKVRGPGRKKAVTVTGPYIVYMLSEEQIIDDWRIIRKGMKKSSPSTSS